MGLLLLQLYAAKTALQTRQLIRIHTFRFSDSRNQSGNTNIYKGYGLFIDATSKRPHLSLSPVTLLKGNPIGTSHPKVVWRWLGINQGTSGLMANALSTKELIDQYYITEEN